MTAKYLMEGSGVYYGSITEDMGGGQRAGKRLIQNILVGVRAYFGTQERVYRKRLKNELGGGIIYRCRPTEKGTLS